MKYISEKDQDWLGTLVFQNRIIEAHKKECEHSKNGFIVVDCVASLISAENAGRMAFSAHVANGYRSCKASEMPRWVTQSKHLEQSFSQGWAKQEIGRDK